MKFSKKLNEVLNEVKIEKVDSPTGLLIPVYVDPSPQELPKVMKTAGGTLRGIFHNNVIYTWEAYSMTHAEAKDKLYLEGTFVGFYVHSEEGMPYANGFYAGNDKGGNAGDLDFDDVPPELLRLAGAY